MVKNYDLNWARTNAGLSQTEAALKMEVDRKTFNRWETGVVNIPPAKWSKFLKLIALDASAIPKALGPSLPDYIGGVIHTPYVPLSLHYTTTGYWPTAALRKWRKDCLADAGGLLDDWCDRVEYFGRGVDESAEEMLGMLGTFHDSNVSARWEMNEWVKRGWLEKPAEGAPYACSEDKKRWCWDEQRRLYQLEKLDNATLEDLL